MGVSTSVDRGRPDAARHSIRGTFTLRVAVPAACLALLWLLALAAALRLALAGRSLSGSHALLLEYGLLAVAGLAAIAAGAALTGSFGRMLAHDLDALAAAAQQVAGLPTAVSPGERPGHDRRPGFGAGKTTLVGAISEVRPLCTEELLTSVSTPHGVSGSCRAGTGSPAR